jgi:hypothetical protein
VPAIPTKALADHWHTSTAYIRGLRTRKAGPQLPAFEDRGAEQAARFAEADAWRAIHAPARPGRVETRPPDGADTGKFEEGAGGEETVDTAKFLVETEDFDGWVIEQAEEVVKIQIGLYRRACATGDQYRIRQALDNWEVAARRCAELRKRFLELQESATNMIPLDRASDIVGRELGLLQQLLDDFGVRVGALANPERPEVGTAAINAAVDELYRQIQNANAAITHATAEKQVA